MSAAGEHPNRLPITISIMLATTMNSLDMTIANVALPHIQGSVSASQEQIAWVLTSYIVAAALATPLTGWLSDRLGRKHLFLISIAGFTLASLACGAANSLEEMVIFRLLQGLFGAPLIPLSQAVLLDINPPEKHGQAMSIWGAGTMLGPIFGPALGGWLTEQFSWRWVFLINLPVGIIALVGVWLFIENEKNRRLKPFDFLGYGGLLMFVGGLQMMLDRGPALDWFYSIEVWIEALIAAAGLWVFVAHTLTAEHPFFDRRLARDRNFVAASFCMFAVSLLLFSTMALLPPMLQGLMGYPVLTSGVVMMPRGIGSFIAMFLVGRLVGKVDTRLILLAALGLSAFGLWQMTQFDLAMDDRLLITSGFIQGFGIGLFFTPLSTLAFATIAPELRAEGSSVYMLIRSIGSSAGISMMQALMVTNTQAMHSSMAARVIPSDPVVAADLGSRFDLSSIAGLEAVNGEITRQATMVAMINDFRLMFVLTLLCLPLLLLLRPSKKPEPGELPVMHE